MARTHPMTRRQFGRSVSMALAGTAVSAGCSGGGSELAYDELMTRTWRHSDMTIGKGAPLLKELVRYATLAANSHNTQPWKFDIEPGRISVMPDFSRRCSVVDPDDHHLFASLGCATENLVLAARAFGLRANVLPEGLSQGAIRIVLEPASPSESALFRAIPERQCTRAEYDGRPVDNDRLAALETAAQDEGVTTRMFTDKKQLEEILEYVVAGNSAQMNDAAFVEELKQWLRFNETAVVRHRDGLFSASSGNPTFPNWLGKLILKIAFTEGAENEKYRDHIRSSAGIIAFVSEQNDKESWIRVGRCYQRFALRATALGLRHAFVNQAIEVPEVREQFAAYLGLEGGRPDLLVRFGYGPLMPRSARRPLDQVLV